MWFIIPLNTKSRWCEMHPLRGSVVQDWLEHIYQSRKNSIWKWKRPPLIITKIKCSSRKFYKLMVVGRYNKNFWTKMHAVKLSCTQNVGLKQKFPRKCLHRSTKLNRMISNKRFLCLMNATTLLLSHAFFRKLLSSFTLLLTTLSGDTVQLNSGNSLTLSLCGFHLRFLCVNFSKMLSKFS